MAFGAIFFPPILIPDPLLVVLGFEYCTIVPLALLPKLGIQHSWGKRSMLTLT
jgi:hypothetical protein